MNNFFHQRRIELGKRAGKKISQHKIAVAIGVTPNCVGLWERGELIPNLKLAEKMAQAYQVSQDKIEQEIVKLARQINAPKLATA